MKVRSVLKDYSSPSTPTVPLQPSSGWHFPRSDQSRAVELWREERTFGDGEDAERAKRNGGTCEWTLFRLAEIFIFGLGGEDTDAAQALKLLLEAADLGNAVAMLRLFKVFSNEELGAWSIS